MFCKFCCWMLVKPCSSFPFPAKMQNCSRNQNIVYFIPLYCWILCIETLCTVEYSCACTTINSSYLFFAFIFYVSCFIFSRRCWVSHYGRHNNWASLIKQWHIYHRRLDLAVFLSLVRRLWNWSASQVLSLL